MRTLCLIALLTLPLSGCVLWNDETDKNALPPTVVEERTPGRQPVIEPPRMQPVRSGVQERNL
ncbi:MAG: hypothetical protein LBV65_05075 [Desulfovibrio sp.]|jgi:hypothetical protein|nr:hypothetical protein [Desulfovibrio sp.]